jgi:predicted Zn-dependent protease
VKYTKVDGEEPHMNMDRLQDVFKRVAGAAGRPTVLEVVRRNDANAWTDGDKVYVTDALVANMPEREIAAVLGHELGHVVERHIAATNSELDRLHETLTASFSGDSLGSVIASGVVAVALIAATGKRSHTLERRADKCGERYSQAAGYASGAMADALGRLPKAGESFTHPSTADRQNALSGSGRVIRIKIRRTK